MNQILKKYNSLSIVVKATLWFTICSILQKSVSLITTPIFTRLLTTDEYGLYSAYLSWLNIFTVIVTMRLEAGVFNKGMSKFKDDRDGYTSAMQGLTAALTTVALVIYLLCARWINALTELSTGIMLLMILEIYCVPAYNFWIRRMRYDFKYRNVVAVTLALTVSNALVGILAVLLASGNKGTVRIASIVLVYAVFGIGLFAYNLCRGKRLVNLEYWKFAVLFNLPLMPHYFSIYVLQHSDRVMIQKLCGLTEVAIYSVVYNFSMILNTVMEALNHAVIPWLYRELEERRFESIRKRFNLMLVMVAGMLLGFMLFAPEVISILAPRSYYEAIFLIPPITASLLFVFVYTLMGNVEFYYDHNKETMVISMAGAALNIVLNAIFIRLFGYMAAAYTTLVCYIVFACAHYAFTVRIVREKEGCAMFDTRFLLMLSTAFVLLSLGMIALYSHFWIRYGLIVAALAAAVIWRKKLIRLVKMFRKKNG